MSNTTTNIVNPNGDVWQERGTDFWPSNTHINTPVLSPGLYKYQLTQQGWYLSRTGTRYDFQYKIYGAESEPIITRIQTAWAHLDANLGVLLNGVKGTGKTVTAQLVANWAVEQGMAVLIVRGPVPLALILEKLHQNVMVIFDEFEKTHAKQEDQQALLTALDGMSRNGYKRLFMFTTNKKSVDTNFIDRPSRIRYTWEFGRLSNAIIAEVMDDLLIEEMSHLRSDMMLYLNSRAVLSIDVVKTVINEVNIFKERPSDFEKVVNLSEQDARGFTIEILDKNGEVEKTFDDHFTMSKGSARDLRSWLLPNANKKFMKQYVDQKETRHYEASYGHTMIQLIEPTEDPNEWIASLRVDFFKTWVSKVPGLNNVHHDYGMWIDDKPSDWKIPEFTKKLATKEEMTTDENTAKYEFACQDTIYGGERKKFLIRITPKFQDQTYDFSSANRSANVFDA